MSESLEDLMSRNGDKVREVTNYLVESPYFYKEDNEYLFFFLRRHQKPFAKFFKSYFGWSLYIDAKCARVYKDRWYNEAIWPSHRELFTFTRRDECIGFMLLLEFFEHQIDIQGVTVDDKDNLRFRYGDLLEYTHARFQELFDDPESSARRRFAPECSTRLCPNWKSIGSCDVFRLPATRRSHSRTRSTRPCRRFITTMPTACTAASTTTSKSRAPARLG